MTVARRPIEPDAFLSAEETAGTEAFLDYERVLTPEGGILIFFKDLDQRLSYTLWRLVAWTAATGGDGWFLYAYSPVQNWLINVACWFTVAIYNWLIVAKPFECYRSVEIRSDCLILDGEDVFFQQHMAGGGPELEPDDDGNLWLCGTYGTRFVEYCIIRRFDDEDCMPEVFGEHLQAAIEALWGQPCGP